VHYAHLVDRARVHIEKTYVRPLPERFMRWMLATVVPNPKLFRLSLIGGRLGRPFAGLMPGRLKGMVAMAPAKLSGASGVDTPQVFGAEGPRRKRVALLAGCAQPVLRPEINEATVRLLTRHGCEVVIAEGAGCCGAIVHHMGREEDSRAAARTNIAAWSKAIDDGGLDAVVFNASGCGVSLKDYGHLLRNDPEWAAPAARISAISKDVSELLVELGLKKPAVATGQKVTYHTACSMQHGLGLRGQSKRLLSDAGFQVREPAEGHLCCGSAGTYSILQPELSMRLRDRKIANLEATEPEIIAAGNIGCLTHIGGGTRVPMVHTVELLDWATGGPKPQAIG
jgi:glycolate oxidase iron-sulfur subunit